MTRPISNVSFTRTHIPYAAAFTNCSECDLTGVFVLYHVKNINGVDDLVPLFLGYGNIVTELRSLEERLKFIGHDPLYYDYIDRPSNPEHLLASLRLQFKPVFAS